MANIPIVFARELHLIEGGELHLTYKQEPSGAYVEVARLPASACVISGSFNTAGLAQGLYNAAFVIKIEGDHPPNERMNVTLTLMTPAGNILQEKHVDLNNRERDNWIKIESNPFAVANEEFEFRMKKTGIWQEHVFVNAIVVKPA